MPSRPLIGLCLTLVAPVAAQDTAAVRRTAITYITSEAVYVGAGRLDGLIEGQVLEVISGDRVTARLKVVYLASHQASTAVLDSLRAPAAGDVVRYRPSAAASAPARAPQSVGHAVRSRHGPGLHGRLGVRYLLARDPTTGAGTSQPSFDLRLDANTLAGSPVGLTLDLRTRRTTTTRVDGSTVVDGHTRVYQASLNWRPVGQGLRLGLGRQYLLAVTSVSLFDGALAEWRGGQFTVGAFGGVEPEPEALGLSADTRDAGAYLQFHSPAGTTGPWSLTTGVVGSYTLGHANREFGFVQAGRTGRTWSLYGLQEVDYYRPWKVSQGESSLSPTSTYLSGSVRPATWFQLNAGYDNRRRVRLYRDAVDPLTAFDDTYRQGAWGGLSFNGRRVRLGGEVRLSDGASVGRATSYGLTFGLDRLTAWGLGITTRANWYRNPLLDGRLFAARIGLDPAAALRLELSGGLRLEDNPLDDPPSRSYRWVGTDLDLSLSRSWFWSLSGQLEHGPDSSTRQLFSSLAWRF